MPYWPLFGFCLDYNIDKYMLSVAFILKGPLYQALTVFCINNTYTNLYFPDHIWLTV